MLSMGFPFKPRELLARFARGIGDEAQLGFGFSRRRAQSDAATAPPPYGGARFIVQIPATGEQ